MLRVVVALAVGYAVGARAGSKDIDQVAKALHGVRESEEFEDLALAVRSHVGETLRELASMVDRAPHLKPAVARSADLVDEVRGLFVQE